MQENIQKIISSASMTFLESEQIIFRGLVRYVTGCLDEFLTASQVSQAVSPSSTQLEYCRLSVPEGFRFLPFKNVSRVAL